MKKLIIICIAVLMFTMCLAGCQMPESDKTEPTNQYEIEETQDIWRMVYAEQHIFLWVNTLDNSVWISMQENSMTPYTINGKTVFWRGSLEETFSYENLK